jgi:hypothetical protein
LLVFVLVHVSTLLLWSILLVVFVEVVENVLLVLHERGYGSGCRREASQDLVQLVPGRVVVEPVGLSEGGEAPDLQESPLFRLPVDFDLRPDVVAEVRLDQRVGFVLERIPPVLVCPRDERIVVAVECGPLRLVPIIKLLGDWVSARSIRWTGSKGW